MFIQFTKDEFESNLNQDFETIDDKKSNEIIYSIKTSHDKINCRIYSTIDKFTNKSRDIGKDAIRIVYWDNVNNRPIGKSKKILRTEGATTIWKRISQRVDEFISNACDQNIVDFNYVRAILKQMSWSNFANSLLESLDDYGKLTDKQLDYVIGKINPKGKATFETQVLKDNPNFINEYLEIENEKQTDENEQKEENRIENTESKEETGAGGDSLYRNQARSEDIRCKELVKTKDYSYYQYSFSEFNPVQSQIIPIQEKDSNIIISANTSAGKTVCAEILMDYCLKQNKRIIYLSPLKSLTQEKYDDWQKRFSRETITILTGDYVLSKEMMLELEKSRIICMTSEMLDSRTRKMEQEKNYWMREVGLIVVDESHTISQASRGHAIESGIMRFSRINSNARVLFLSATMPNVDELANWLTTLNQKQTDVIYSTWRPVELQYSFEEYEIKYNKYGYEDYWTNQNAKKEKAIEIAMSKPNEKFLIFCHSKNDGRSIVKALNQLNENAHFHNADLDLSERLEIEESFQNRENGIRVLVSTSTLAYGRNLPARNVIIVGVHRGLNEVDSLDIIQMCGRAGRYGIDDAGFVYMIIPQNTTEAWQHTLKNPKPILSVLNNHNVLAFHILSEIETKEITSPNDLLKWYERSLAFRQNIKPFSIDDAIGVLDDLKNMQMVAQRHEFDLFITGLGQVSAWLYFSPYDIYTWYKNFDRIKDDKDDLSLAWALGDIPSNNMGYIPKDLINECDEFRWRLKNKGIVASDALPNVVAIYNQLQGQDDTGLLNTLKRNIIFDCYRIMSAIGLIDSKYAKWNLNELWEVLPVRLKYGISENLVELTRIKSIGGKRAKKLWDKGFKMIEDVADRNNKRKLASLFTVKFVNEIQEDARKLLNKGE